LTAIRSSRLGFTVLAMASAMTLQLDAQTVTIGQTKEAVTIHAPGLGFIRGEPLARLKDGHTVRVDLELAVLPGPGGTPAAQARQTFVLSYDLWEERFAVSMTGPPPKSMAYLTTAAAEAWCLEQVTVPFTALGRLGRDAPFWLRLEYRVIDSEAAPPSDDGGLTLRGLIETFSRRKQPNIWTHAVEAGPFRLHP
jgi:hypothetical protein